MHRTEGEGHVGNRFDPGDPLIPRPATLLTHDWCNAVQEELATTIEGLGGTLNTAATDGTPNQLLTKLNAKFGRLDLENTWSGAQTFAARPTYTAPVAASQILGVNALLHGDRLYAYTNTSTGLQELLIADTTYFDPSIDFAFEWSRPGGATITGIEVLFTNTSSSSDFLGFGRIVRRAYASAGFADSLIVDRQPVAGGPTLVSAAMNTGRTWRPVYLGATGSIELADGEICRMVLGYSIETGRATTRKAHAIRVTYTMPNV